MHVSGYHISGYPVLSEKLDENMHVSGYHITGYTTPSLDTPPLDTLSLDTRPVRAVRPAREVRPEHANRIAVLSSNAIKPVVTCERGQKEHAKLYCCYVFKKRDKNLLEDDVLVGAVLGFYIGNEVSTPTLCRHKWCPISGRIGETACGISSITAAHTWGLKH